jgi:tRNA (guanine-N7-)-methyltransferase
MARWAIAVDGDELSFADVFGESDEHPTDVVLDIGFGGGEALIELAETRPHEAVIGVDVHTPGIAAVLEAVETRGLQNVRVVEGDVIEFLPRIPARTLDSIRVFFPDPWPKQRQRPRRLIRPDVVRRLAQLLRDGGTLHMATDDDGYATQMQRVCDADPALIGGVIERPAWRPMTRFEQRAIDEGHRSVDLSYIASQSSPSDSSSALR